MPEDGNTKNTFQQCSNLSAHGTTQGLSSTLLPKQSRGLSGRQPDGNPRHVERARREYVLNALCWRACAFLLLTADVSRARRHVASDANAADSKSLLAHLAAHQTIRSRWSCAESKTTRHQQHSRPSSLCQTTWPRPDISFADHCSARQNDTGTNRTDSLSCQRHRENANTYAYGSFWNQPCTDKASTTPAL